MIRNKKIFFLGLLLFIFPVLGFPLFWKWIFVAIIALGLMVLSIDFSHFKISLPEIERDFFVPTSVHVSKEVIEQTTQQTTQQSVQQKRVTRPRKKKDVVSNDVSSIDF